MTPIILCIALQATQPQDPPPSPEEVAKDQRLHDPRYAVVGERLITFKDVMTEWDLRRTQSPQLPEEPTRNDFLTLLRRIVEDWLWIDHARSFERYSLVVTQELLDTHGRRVYNDLYENPPKPEFKPILDRWVERAYARELILTSDPDIKRAIHVRPEELREYYRAHPDDFVIPEEVLLGRALISKSIHGDRARPLMEELRSRVLQGVSLESAVQELAPGAYRDMGWNSLHESGLRQEILDFVGAASPGQVSEIIEGSASFSLYELRDRTASRRVEFEEASARLSNELRNARLAQVERRYLVLKVMPKAYFEPLNLFDEELQRWGFRRR